MKKFITVMICLALSASLFTACGKNDSAPSDAQVTVTAEKKTKPSLPNVKKADEIKKKKAGKVDVNLASDDLNANYDNLVRMLIEKEDYVGKKVLLKGKMNTALINANGKKVFTCSIENESYSLSQDLEFELTDDYKYPGDYPAEDEIITVYGTFEIYEENGSKYCRLKDAVFTD